MAKKQLPLGIDEQGLLRALITASGAGEASKRVGLPAATLARAAAGFPICIGTKLVLSDFFARR